MIYLCMFVISSYAVTLGTMFKYTFEFLTYVFDSGYIIEKDSSYKNIINSLEETIKVIENEEKTMSKQNRTRELRELKLMKQELLDFIEESKKELEQEEKREDKKLSLKK